ncbi:hypothetical protein BLOT_013390 [Blomia tropicalis]|nr:hypothetical protein BLOT_013390 [Blomia tropicalis]
MNRIVFYGSFIRFCRLWFYQTFIDIDGSYKFGCRTFKMNPMGLDLDLVDVIRDESTSMLRSLKFEFYVEFV